MRPPLDALPIILFSSTIVRTYIIEASRISTLFMCEDAYLANALIFELRPIPKRTTRDLRAVTRPRITETSAVRWSFAMHTNWSSSLFYKHRLILLIHQSAWSIPIMVKGLLIVSRHCRCNLLLTNNLTPAKARPSASRSLGLQHYSENLLMVVACPRKRPLRSPSHICTSPTCMLIFLSSHSFVNHSPKPRSALSFD